MPSPPASVPVSGEITLRSLTYVFDTLDGSSKDAAHAASEHTSISSWVIWQTTQSAIFGGAAAAIPVLYVPMIVVDVAVLLHKMAYCAWGIGGILKAPVDGRADLVILGLWSGAIKENDLPAVLKAGAGLGLFAGFSATATIPKLVKFGVEEGIISTAKAASKAIVKVGPKVVAKTGAKGFLLLGALAPLGGAFAEKVAVKIAGKATFLA